MDFLPPVPVLRRVSLAIAEVYLHRSMDQAIVSGISPGQALEDILGELREIGYPVAE